MTHILNMEKAINNLSEKKHAALSVAPMMDWTNRHCRFFHRLLAPNALLYTEMVVTGALIHGDIKRHLQFNSQEHPVSLQLGGSDPVDLAKSAELGQSWGYDHINLNCGCPSPRVQKGSFGACLMSEPDLVASCIKSMKDSVDIPVTIKCRIGIDDHDPQQMLYSFVEKNADAGCETFIVHARKAWLKGLSPKENRDVPPLDYELVYKLKQDFPELTIILNGGLTDIDQINHARNHCDGVMLGRLAYQEPWELTKIEEALYGTPPPTRESVVNEMGKYLKETCKDKKIKPKAISRHMMGLYKHERGGKIWRQALATLPETDDILDCALDEMSICA